MKESIIEVLKVTEEARIREIDEYQLNINNFERALVKVEGDPELQEFKTHLESLLKTNLLEQKKSKIMLEVIQDQLREATI